MESDDYSSLKDLIKKLIDECNDPALLDIIYRMIEFHKKE